MKTFFALALTLTFSTAALADRSCTLSKLFDDNHFEESLSKEEYPDLDVWVENGKTEISIGANLFKNDRDYSIKSLPTIALPGYATYSIKAKKKDLPSYIVSFRKHVATVSVDQRPSEKKIAEFLCR